MRFRLVTKSQILDDFEQSLTTGTRLHSDNIHGVSYKGALFSFIIHLNDDEFIRNFYQM